jgi:hypothetical protein
MGAEFGQPFLDDLERLAYEDAAPLGTGRAKVLLPRPESAFDFVAAREELQRALG